MNLSRGGSFAYWSMVAPTSLAPSTVNVTLVNVPRNRNL
jgi:hypothetical protein